MNTLQRLGVGLIPLALIACDASVDAPADETTGAPAADAGFINVYSARHYDEDDVIYERFTTETGIDVRRIEASGDLLIERVRAEGDVSPADVIITVDAGRLWRAEEAGLFQPIGSNAVNAAIPARLRDPDGQWVGLAKRARVIVHAPDRIAAEDVDTYAELADPALKGRLCVRSSGNIYNLSLLAGLIERLGAEQAEAWAAGVAANFARDPQGGDTDQIKAVAAGVCDVALVNHYYWVRLANADNEDDVAVSGATAIIWPDQDGDGTHVNVSGVGLAANAPNEENARRFIEFLVEPAQQTLIAKGNNEFPAADAPTENPVLDAIGRPKEEVINVRVYGERQAEAAAIFDRVGWP
ncbi:MAG: extracellular solute-binding protein [Alphaproteobacteria bacterium]